MSVGADAVAPLVRRPVAAAAPTAAATPDVSSLTTLDEDAVDWTRVRRTTYLLHQAFRYDYPEPIRNLRHRLMVIPPEAIGDQRRIMYRLDMADGTEPMLGMLNERADRFGNVTHTVTAATVRTSAVFEAWVVAERREGDDQRLDRRWLTDRRLLTASALTDAGPALADAVADCAATGATGLELADVVCSAVHAHMRYEFGHTSVETTAAQAWAGGVGVCQDYAHIMLAICRRLGLPSRYVSGHLVGEGATHAWVDVLVPTTDGAAARAIAFDPTHNRRVGMNYLTIAAGRDYLDVAPTSGRYESPYAGTLATTRRVGVASVEYAA